LYQHKNDENVDNIYIETIEYLSDLTQSMNNLCVYDNIHNILNTSYLGQMARYIYRLLKDSGVVKIENKLDYYHRE